jgi:hypothetical protein
MPFRGGSRTFDAKRSNKMTGGSRASNRVMHHLSTKTMPNDYTPNAPPMGLEGSGVQPYELTGGSKASDCVTKAADVGGFDMDGYFTKMDLPRRCAQSGGAKSKRRRSKSKSGKRKLKGKRKTNSKRKTSSKRRRTMKRKVKCVHKSCPCNCVGPCDCGSCKCPCKCGKCDCPLAKQSGGGFANMTGCGPVNYPQAGARYAKHFGGTSCPSQKELMNPASMPLAGSGDMGLGGFHTY